VGVEALFLGSGWEGDPSLSAAREQVVGFLNYITGSTYMDMLTRAGYGVGRGSYLDGCVDPVALPGVFTDQQIEIEVAAAIAAGRMRPPDANRLYFVFVQPGVEVVAADGSNSVTDFWSYHSDFAGPAGAPVSYAVVPYLDGSSGTLPGLTLFETVTEVSSHELAEAVTDPFGNNVGVSAWYDGSWRDPNTGQRGGEIADIADSTIVDLGGYVMQGVANRHDRPMIPAGATPVPRFGGRRHAHDVHRQPHGHRAGRRPSARSCGQYLGNLGTLGYCNSTMMEAT
jgi:hypothetical protein